MPYPLGRSQNNYNGFIGNRMLLGFILLEIMNFQITWPRSMKLPTRPLFTIILAIYHKLNLTLAPHMQIKCGTYYLIFTENFTITAACLPIFLCLFF